jgi:hypothetical protein
MNTVGEAHPILLGPAGSRLLAPVGQKAQIGLDFNVVPAKVPGAK